MSNTIPIGTHTSEQYSGIPGKLASSTAVIDETGVSLSTKVDGNNYIVSKGNNQIVGGRIALGSESYACILTNNGFTLDGISFTKAQPWY